MEIIWTFVKLQEIFTLPTKIKQCYKLLKLNKRDKDSHIKDIFLTYAVSTYTTIIKPQYYFLGVYVIIKNLVK